MCWLGALVNIQHLDTLQEPVPKCVILRSKYGNDYLQRGRPILIRVYGTYHTTSTTMSHHTCMLDSWLNVDVPGCVRAFYHRVQQATSATDTDFEYKNAEIASKFDIQVGTCRMGRTTWLGLQGKIADTSRPVSLSNILDVQFSPEQQQQQKYGDNNLSGSCGR